MAVSDTDVKAIYSPGTGTTTFAIPFEFESTSQIKVYTVDESTDPPTETLKTISTHYTLTGGPPVTNVEFNTAPNAAGTGIKVVVVRVTSLVQSTEYTANGPFPATSHEAALDTIVQMIQELDERLDRAALLRLSTSLSGLTLPDPEAGAVIGWNSDADDLENIEITDGNVRADAVSCSSGATTKAVTLSSTYSSTSYSVIVTWENTTDASPMFQPVVITAKSTSGFTVSWNTALDTANYKLNYITIPDA